MTVGQFPCGVPPTTKRCTPLRRSKLHTGPDRRAGMPFACTCLAVSTDGVDGKLASISLIAARSTPSPPLLHSGAMDHSTICTHVDSQQGTESAGEPLPRARTQSSNTETDCTARCTVSLCTVCSARLSPRPRVQLRDPNTCLIDPIPIARHHSIAALTTRTMGADLVSPDLRAATIPLTEQTLLIVVS